ncbi:MAG: hypothetical protein HKM89_09515 [Gemmatimonadales bacterium]|nr:hypothetical protein [Gemmatimonadales bacterium]
MLTLQHLDFNVIGIGQDFGIGPSSPLLDKATVTGGYADSTVELRMRYRAAGTVRFAGKLVGPDILQGTWTRPAPGVPSQVAFYRQPD